MKFPTLFSTLLLFTTNSLAAEPKLDVASVISDYYPQTPVISASVSTALASALYAVETSWSASPQYTSARAAIFSAAPSEARESIQKSGYRYKSLMAQPWYSKDVPASAQTAYAGQVKALNDAAAKVVGTPGSTANAAPRETGMVVGVLGVVGGVLAVL